MGQRLEEYLAKLGATQLDASILESYASEMTEEVIPKIVEDIKQREQLAAELRFSTSTASRSKKKRD